MLRKNCWIHGASIILALVIALSWASAGFAEEIRMAGDPTPCSTGCENESNNTLRVAGAPGPDRSFSRALHAARLAGDMQRVQELEAQIPQMPLIGESAGGTTLQPSTTVWGKGEYMQVAGGSAATTGFMGGFGSDEHVRATNTTYEESDPDMVADSNGNFYVAWQDDVGYIQIYKSTDMGQTWGAYAYFVNPDAYLREPSLAVGEGNSDVLLVAYIADAYLADPAPEVATAPLSTGVFTIHSVPVFLNWEDYAKPVIWTDSYKFNGWYAYLTCEGIYDSATRNINVCTWRSTNYGTTWGSELAVLGNNDTEAWVDPDGSFGTTENRSFVVCFNEDDSTMYTVISDDDGVTYPTQAAIYTHIPHPMNPVDPEIEAATDTDNVMICCTRDNGSYADCIGQGYSTDAGDNWSTMWPLNGSTEMYEYGATLTANEDGGSWHLAYTRGNDHHVMYTYRPQDLSDYWPNAAVVDDAGFASGDKPMKGIASIHDLDLAGVVWSDYRDGYPDYDIYFALNRELFVPRGPDTIQGAIDAALDQFTIYVDEGTYMENINFLGKAITVQSTGSALDTVIDGGQSGTVATFNNGESPSSLLRGFTLTNGDYASSGGIFCNGTSPFLENLVITNNSAAYGGGLFCWNAQPTVSFCTFYNNSATVGGGSVYLKGTSYAVIESSILWNGSAPMGPEIHIEGGNILVLSCDVEGGWAGAGSNNINQNPRFVNAGAGDFHLNWQSPCINRGGSLAIPPTDFEGDAREYMSRMDMGADEYTGTHSLAADAFTLSVSGGEVNFNLAAQSSNAGRYYVILGSLDGSNPGTPLPGGQTVLPINWDSFTDRVLRLLNYGTFQNFLGVLNGSGMATAKVSIPGVNPANVGKWMTYAYCLEGTPNWDFASSPIWVQFVP